MVGINPDFDYLYDPQQRRPVGLCVNCGSEIYSGTEDLCEECRDEMETGAESE